MKYIARTPLFSILFPVIVIVIILTGMRTCCWARVSCDDWMEKGGYCVDYVKTKIPTFPLPQTAAELAALKNKDNPDIAEGDVAIFRYGNYWHVAYVEQVHLNKRGEATTIDVSEMNFGRQLSFHEFKNIWKVKNESEWRRAISCGVSLNYNKKTTTKNIALSTVTQVWSPFAVTAEVEKKRRARTVIYRVRRIFARFFPSLQSKENS